MIATNRAINMNTHLTLASNSTSTTHHHKHLSFHNPNLENSSFCNSSFISVALLASKNVNRPKWTLKCDTIDSSKTNGDIISIQEKEDEEIQEGKTKVYYEVIGEREVVCEVEVVSWRERTIRAETSVESDIQSVWDALTDYDRLADFIPNLASCERLPCPHPGRVWLEQKGLQRALYWSIEARVLLELQEIFNSENDREISFSLVEGDFKKFEGKWSLKSTKRSPETTLSYEVTVVPKFNIPAILLEKIIRSELPVNLHAVACRAESGTQHP